MAKPERVIGFLLIFFLMLLSYSPIQAEINSNAVNATNTNIWGFLQGTFSVIWGIMLVAFLFTALYSSFG